MAKPIVRKIPAYRPKGWLKRRVLKTATVVGLAGLAAFGGVKFNAARQAELKARADFFQSTG